MDWSLKDEALTPAHELYVGATGSAKSTRAEQQIYKVIEAGLGCVVMSPSSDLINSLLARFDEETLARTHIVDPMNPVHAVGINILEISNPGLCDVDAIAFTSTFLLDTIRDIFGGEALQARSGGILKEFLGLLLTAGRHPAECYLGWDPGEDGKRYRQLLYPECRHGNPFYEAYIARNIDSLPGLRDRQNMLEASLNKMKVLFDFPAITVTLLQPNPILDLKDIIDNNKILLVDLSSAYLGTDGVQILGGFLISALYMSAIRLNAEASRNGKYFPCFLDEFWEYGSERILKGLALTRKMGLFFSLITQDQGNTERRFPGSWDSILNNTDRKYAFRCADEKTRNSLIPHLFGYNIGWKESVGTWQLQKEMHAAEIGALQRGEYYYQNGKLFENSGILGNCQKRYLKARLEGTTGGGIDIRLPPLQDESRSIDDVAMQRRMQLATRDTQGVSRNQMYSDIKNIYLQESDRIMQLGSTELAGVSNMSGSDNSTPLPRS